MENTIRNIGVQKDCNKRIKNYLANNGIIATPQLIKNGSMRNTIRIYQKNKEFTDGCQLSFWNKELVDKFTALGFMNFDKKPLTIFSGDGGRFHIFATHSKINEILSEE